MNRLTITLVLLSMPLWLGVVLLLWSINPLLILIPVGLVVSGLVMVILFLVTVGEFRTCADWDFMIRSVLHRLGFKVAPPDNLDSSITLDDSSHWQSHTHDDQ